MNIRYPKITGSTDREQLQQLKTYLYQLVDQLNVSGTGTAQSQPTAAVKQATAMPTTAAKAADEERAWNNFNEIKALIIKSADIVNAYYEEINKRLESVYVAEASFDGGTTAYIEQTAHQITENAEEIERAFENIQQINGTVSTLVKTNAWIKTGLLEEEEGVSVYGIEVGQKTTRNGEEVFNRYARFTADRLSFYDRYDNEVAYVSDRKLYIRSAQIQEELQIGNFVTTVQEDGSTVKRWIANKEET